MIQEADIWIIMILILGRDAPHERKGGDGVVKKLHLQPVAVAPVWGREIFKLSNLKNKTFVSSFNIVIHKCVWFIHFSLGGDIKFCLERFFLKDKSQFVVSVTLTWIF